MSSVYVVKIKFKNEYMHAASKKCNIRIEYMVKIKFKFEYMLAACKE